MTQEQRRLRMMISGACMIFFTGFPHVWSIYQPYVIRQTGWSQGQASICFYLALAVFVFGNIIGGKLQDNGNPKKILWIGGGIFCAGILLSAFVIFSSPFLFYLTYGIFQGFGQGMVYTVILPTAQKWFPDRPGFASGIVVTANGLCGFFLAPASRLLLEAGGAKMALFVVGIFIAIAWICSSLFFSMPEKKETKEQKKQEETVQYTAEEMIHTRKFWYLLCTMLFALLSYFLISPVSQSYQISLGIPETIAVSAVMFGSVMNALTRLLLPTLADRVGRSICIRFVLLTEIAAMAVLGFGRSLPVTAAVVIMYGCYGGIMGSFPSLTSTMFGIQHAGENYGYVMLGIVAATFTAPILTSCITAAGLGQNLVFVAGMFSAFLAFICFACMERERKKKHGISYNEETA